LIKTHFANLTEFYLFLFECAGFASPSFFCERDVVIETMRAV